MPTPIPNESGSPFSAEFSANFGAGAATGAPVTIASLQAYLSTAISMINYVSANLKNMTK